MRIVELFESTISRVVRIDSTKIDDFESGLRTYYGTADWHRSGLEKEPGMTQSSRGLYAGLPHRTALYATGNASQTRFLELEDPNTRQDVVYFDRRDLPKIRSRRAWVSEFDAKNFRKLPTGEYFSEHPGQPIRQFQIRDPFQYIVDNGWIVRVTDDIKGLFKKVQRLHQQGRIQRYGGEGLV